MQKILIALDDSPIAQKVAKTGYRLAKSMEAQAILLHVIPAVPHYSSFDYSPVMGFEGYKNAAMKIGSKDLDELALNYLDKIKVILGGQNIETQVRHVILRAAF